MLGVTMTPTMAHASDKVNVIPSRAQLTVDCRVPPGLGEDVARARIAEVLGEDASQLRAGISVRPSSATLSPVDSPLMERHLRLGRNGRPRGRHGAGDPARASRTRAGGGRRSRAVSPTDSSPSATSRCSRARRSSTVPTSGSTSAIWASRPASSPIWPASCSAERRTRRPAARAAPLLQGAASSARRSISSSLLQAPTEARSRLPLGMLRITMPRSARRSTSAAGSSACQETSVVATAGSDLQAAVLEQRRKLRRQRRPRSWTQLQPASPSACSEASAHALRIAEGNPWSSRLAPSASPESSGCSWSASVAYDGHGGSSRLERVRVHEQTAAALRAAQPFLARGSVEMAAERLHVDRNRAERLCRVEQDGHAGGAQRRCVDHACR